MTLKLLDILNLEVVPLGKLLYLLLNDLMPLVDLPQQALGLLEIVLVVV